MASEWRRLSVGMCSRNSSRGKVNETTRELRPLFCCMRRQNGGRFGLLGF